MTMGVEAVACLAARVEGVQVVTTASSFIAASSRAFSRHPVVAAVGIAALDDEVLALDIALLAQALQERLLQMAALRLAASDQDADMDLFVGRLRQARGQRAQQQSAGGDRSNANDVEGHGCAFWITRMMLQY